jgi:hypothetical protein
MEAAVETGLEEMKARMNVFEEKMDKMDAAGKACLGKTEANIETGQEPSEAESRTGLEEMDTVDFGTNQEKSEAVAVHQEVPNEEDALEIVGAREDRAMAQEQTVGHRNPWKRRDKDDVL